MWEWIGFTAIAIINAAYLPQLYKTVTTKKSRDISIPFFVTIMIGILFYLVYAILINNIVYITSNTLGLIQPAIIIWFAWKYKEEKCLED